MWLELTSWGFDAGIKALQHAWTGRPKMGTFVCLRVDAGICIIRIRLAASTWTPLSGRECAAYPCWIRATLEQITSF